MNIKKFTAKDMRQAMNQVRDALGDDAAILSTRSLPGGGVEVMATQAPPARKPAEDAAPAVNPAELGAMRSELNSIRSLLQLRLNGLAWDQFASQTPAQAAVWERLTAMGLPGDVSRMLLERCPQADSLDQLWRRVLAELARKVPVAAQDPVERGGIFALLGPTGAGKTTTIAKLATRFVLQHGPQDVALVTTDSYRLAAHEQLRTLGRILSVTVRVVDNHYSLLDTLDSLSDKRLVLIDTAGLPSVQPEQQQQLSALAALPEIDKWLVLPCTSQAQLLQATWKTCSLARPSGCILTHLDEACVMGEALALSIRQRLPVIYETFGQAIPDDIARATPQALVRRSVALGRAQAEVPADRSRLASDFGRQASGPATGPSRGAMLS